MLFPGDVDRDPEAMTLGGIEQPRRRHGVQADGVDARRRHPRQVVVRPGGVVPVVAGRHRGERPVRDAPHPQLLVTDIEAAADTWTQPAPGRGSGLGRVSAVRVVPCVVATSDTTASVSSIIRSDAHPHHWRSRIHRLPHHPRAACPGPSRGRPRPRPDPSTLASTVRPVSSRISATPARWRRSHPLGGIEGVIHFAGRKFVAEAMRDPGLYFDVNVAGSLSVLRAMVEAGAQAIVFSSSCTVYGTPCRTRHRGHAAAAGEPVRREQAVRRADARLVRAHPRRSMSLRYFNAAGASFDGRLGERADRTLMLIPMLMLAALGRREPVDIYGTDYPTPDGTAIVTTSTSRTSRRRMPGRSTGRARRRRPRPQSRDRRRLLGPRGHRARGGGQRPTGARALGRSAPGDAVAVWADPSSARRVLGWRARHDLRAMVETAWAWHSKHEDGARRGDPASPHAAVSSRCDSSWLAGSKEVAADAPRGAHPRSSAGGAQPPEGRDRRLGARPEG